jgi:sigma-E factor negative regulatory protein RseC
MTYSSNKQVSHPGIVDEVTPDGLRVRILSASACSSCHAKSACNMAEMEEKLIDIPQEKPGDYQVGQTVEVMMNLSTGTRAVILGYAIPLLVLLFVLITALILTGDEALSGLLGLVSLIPYYAILWLRRDHIRKRTQFFLRP